jgi:hypothetical protein
VYSTAVSSKNISHSQGFRFIIFLKIFLISFYHAVFRSVVIIHVFPLSLLYEVQGSELQSILPLPVFDITHPDHTPDGICVWFSHPGCWWWGEGETEPVIHVLKHIPPPLLLP